MAEEPENLTLRILQDMRDQLNALRIRVDAEQALKADGNTVLLNMVAGVAHDHEQRIERLESR